MIVIGIDIGLTGAVAFVDQRGTCALADIPTIENENGKRIDGRALGEILRRYWPAGEPALALFEDVRPRPQVNGGVRGNTMHSQGSLMRSRGTIEGVLDVLRLEHRIVQPQTWKRFYGLVGAVGEGRPQAQREALKKQISIKTAIDLYPAAKTSLARKKDHNRADALLIAHYGMRLALS